MKRPEPMQLYELLPAYHRQKDFAAGEPLKALLAIIQEQVDMLHGDIGQLYDNWFIETCDDWVVPYLADLVGYRLANHEGHPGDAATRQGARLNHYLFPRREIANTVRLRRRKGTLPVLEELTRSVTEWYGFATESFRPVLATMAAPTSRNGISLNPFRERNQLPLIVASPQPKGSEASLEALLGTAPRFLNVLPRITPGPNEESSQTQISLYVWRRPLDSIHGGRPGQSVDPNAPGWTFDSQGRKTPLRIRPKLKTDDTLPTSHVNLPLALTKELAENHPELYGPDASFRISHWNGQRWNTIHWNDIGFVRLNDLAGREIPADGKSTHIDPEQGWFVTSLETDPANLRVDYHFAVPGFCGGGEYRRQDGRHGERLAVSAPVPQPSAEVDLVQELSRSPSFERTSGRLKLTEGHQYHLELPASDQFTWPTSISLEVAAGAELILSSQLLKRAVIAADAGSTQPWLIQLQPGSRLEIDGILVTLPIRVESVPRELNSLSQQSKGTERLTTTASPCSTGSSMNGSTGTSGSVDRLPELTFRHSTLMHRPGDEQPVLTITGEGLRLHFASCRTGQISIEDSPLSAGQCPRRPFDIQMQDTIWAATLSPLVEVVSPRPSVRLTVARSTLLGSLELEGPLIGEDSVFLSDVNVHRYDQGYLRHCYVYIHEHSERRTPLRYRCVPSYSATVPEVIKPEELFVSLDPTHPGYAQLRHTVSQKILRGAEDESEMGAFHDEFFPQRKAVLESRLSEFTPADAVAHLLIADDLPPTPVQLDRH